MRKDFLLESIKVYNEGNERKFTGYASTFGNVDRVGDIVMAGSFQKSLDSHRIDDTMPAMLLHHDLHRPIGRWTSMMEDSKGLHVEGILTKGVKDSDEAYALLQDGAINSMSIGYQVVNEEYDPKSKNNLLHEIKLHEVSLVTLPANGQALVSSVKDRDGEINVRELEVVLRDAGLSRKEAKAVLAQGFKALSEPEPVEEKAVDVERDAQAAARTDRLKRVMDRIHAVKSK